MPTSLFQYEMLPTTWFYLSSLLILAVFFRFNRVWSVRNFDVLSLISLTPGLVYIAMGSMFQGYLWLWIVGILIFCRLSFDVFLRRRPLLEPNLSFLLVRRGVGVHYSEPVYQSWGRVRFSARVAARTDYRRRRRVRALVRRGALARLPALFARVPKRR